MKVFIKHIGQRVFLPGTGRSIVIAEKHGKLLVSEGFGYMVEGKDKKPVAEQPANMKPPTPEAVKKAREAYSKHGETGKK